MANVNETDGIRRQELKNHPPVTSDTKRVQARKLARERLGVKRRVERILDERFEKSREFHFLSGAKATSRPQETVSVEDPHHARSLWPQVREK